MSLLEAIVLGIAQGLGEFLPISSSAHLVIIPWLFGWQDPGLGFDVGLHWGTLAAGSTIGYKKIDRFAPVTVSAIRVRMTRSLAPPVIKKLSVHDATAP